MSSAKDGVKRVGAFLTTIGLIGSICAAIVLYALEFHVTLASWAAQIVPATQQLLPTPEVIAHARMLGMGLLLAGGSTVLLATGLGILIGMQAIREAKQDLSVPEHRVHEAVAPRAAR